MDPKRTLVKQLITFLLLSSWIVFGCSLVSSLAGATPTPGASSIPLQTSAATPPSSPPAETAAPQASEPAGETVSPATANPPSRSDQKQALLPDQSLDYAVLSNANHYAIDLQIDYQALAFQGQERLAYTNSEDTTLDRLYFRLLPNGGGSFGDGSLRASDVQVNQQSVETQLSLNDTVLEVPLPQPLSPGQNAQIDMQFQGEVPEDFGGGYGIYNYTEGVMALAAWYPTLAVYDQEGWNLDPVSDIGDSVFSDIAFYDVNVTVANNIVVAATGVNTGSTQEGSDTRTHYVSGPARDFFMIMSPDFQSVSQSVAGTTINSYYLPGYQDAGQFGLSVAADSLKIFNQEFGDYPYTELDMVQAPMRNAAGVEYPSIILIGGFLYDRYNEPTFTVATAHEVAHQWWYNVVGNDVFDNPWMDESLTTYSSSLYYEFEKGPQYVQGLENSWQEAYNQAVQRGADDQIAASLEHFEYEADPRAYGAVVYNKGGLFFEALRKKIGDQAFFQALENYYQENKYQIATPEELKNAFEQTYGQSLDDFYQQWLYSPKP
jgi:hypothetical protein